MRICCVPKWEQLQYIYKRNVLTVVEKGAKASEESECVKVKSMQLSKSDLELEFQMREKFVFEQENIFQYRLAKSTY